MRPLQHLRKYKKQYPSLTKQMNGFLKNKGKDGFPSWPRYCMLPMAAYYAIASNGGTLGLDCAPDIASLAALGPWDFSQSIYQIDTNVLSALVDSEVSGDLPSDVITRLPEYSAYVETPNMKWFNDKLHGFFVHLEYDVNTESPELRFLLDCENIGLTPVPVPLGYFTIDESIRRMVNESERQAKLLDINLSDSVDTEDVVGGISIQINSLISIVLYLCSEEPEIDDDRHPGAFPSRPVAKKIKKDWKLFPAKKPRFWKVGTKTGEQLRKDINSTDSVSSDKTIRTHIRKGHWHGYWLGPRKSERKFIYKWLSPTVVYGREEQSH